MLSLRLGDMIIHSQIARKLILTWPESIMKIVNIGKEFQQKQILKIEQFFIFRKIHFRRALYRRPNKLWVKRLCTCNLQCFDHVCNLLFIICLCSKISFFKHFFFFRVGWNFLLALSLLWLECCCCFLKLMEAFDLTAAVKLYQQRKNQ